MKTRGRVMGCGRDKSNRGMMLKLIADFAAEMTKKPHKPQAGKSLSDLYLLICTEI